MHLRGSIDDGVRQLQTAVLLPNENGTPGDLLREFNEHKAIE